MANSNNFNTPYAFLSFPSLAKAKVNTNDDGTLSTPQFEVSLVFPKHEFTQPVGVITNAPKPTTPWQLIAGEAKALFEAEFAKEGRVFQFERVFKDQDAPNTKGTVPSLKYPNLKGMYSITAKNRKTVACYDNKGHLVPRERIEEVFYPGCKVRANISFWTFVHPKNKGIAVNLNSIQKVGDGEVWGGGAHDHSNDFTAIDDGSDNPALYGVAPQAVQYAQPAPAPQAVQYAQPAPAGYPQPVPAPQAVQYDQYGLPITVQTFHG